MACDLADRITAATDSIETDAALFHDIVQGDDQTTVTTENGPVNSAAKAIRLFVDRTDFGGPYIPESTGIPGTDYDQGSFIEFQNDIYIVELDFTSTNLTADLAAGDLKLAIEISPIIQLATDAAAAAAISETNAATSETNAGTSATDADDTLKEFETEYLGAKAVDPTLDNEGNALITGALYFNTGSNVMRVFDGSSFIDAAGTPPVVTEDCVTLTAGQTVITVLSTENAGVYVEGVRLAEDQYVIDSLTQITLAQEYPVGFEVCVVARDFQGKPFGQGVAIPTVFNLIAATGDADPGSGNFGLNNATQSSATIAFVSNISNGGVDIAKVLLNLQEGDRIWLQDQANEAKGHLYKVDSGGIVDATTYVKIPILVEDSLADLVVADDVGILIYWSSLVSGVPLGHAASHQDGGSDEIATATPGADVIPKANGSGELADAFISEGSVTQHVAAIDHDGLLNFAITEHRIINDSGNSTIELLSSEKILELLSSVSAGVDLKDPVATSTEGLGDITLSGEQTLNGVTTSSSRVAVIEQTAGEDNGYYLTAAGAWTRTTDADEDEEVTNGMLTIVDDSNSTVFKHKYMLTTPDPIIVGTTSLTFASLPGVEFGTTAGTATEGNDPRVPIQDENDALVGTEGTPSAGNVYVTDSDPRLSLSSKAGVIAFATFAGNPKIATVTFATAFADVNYTPDAIGGDGNVISYQSLVAGSFVINLNTNSQPGVDVKWSAIEHGEN